MTSIFGRVFGGGRDTSGGSIAGQWDAISRRPGQFAGTRWYGRDPKQFTPTDLADSGIYDEYGYTRGLPGEAIAPDVQYGAEQVVARRNDRILAAGGANAQAALQSGLETLGSYRPGGAAQLLSGLYQSQAQAYLTTAQARQIQAPNDMFRYDERQGARAEKAAAKAGQIQTVASLLGAAASAAAGGIGGPAGTVAGATATPGGMGTTTFPGGVGATIPGGAGSPALTPGVTESGAETGGGPQVPGAGPQSADYGAGGSEGGPKPGGGAPGGGPQAGPGGAGGQKQVASGAVPGGMAGGGGGSTSGFPSPGPATSAVAARLGMDPAHVGAMLDQIYGRDTGWFHMMNARLSLLMARDTQIMSGAA